MRLQEFIHSLEQGGLAKWVKFLVVVAIIVVGYVFFVFSNRFHGLSDGKGMDQAQISREIARGNGFTTKDFRPLAIAMLKEKKGTFPIDKTPDIYYAPLHPYINSLFLFLTKGSWTMTPRNPIFPSDRVIASVSAFFMILGFGINYLTFRRIFDPKISGLAIGIVLICDQFWTFTQTGLPQMLMFFLFSCCGYIIFRAIEAQRQEKQTLGWLAAAGLFFGLLALSHGLTVWVFGGAIVFSLLYFTPRFQGTAVMIAVFLLIYSPWLARNYKVSGNIFGIAHLATIGSMDGSEASRLRSNDISLNGLSLSALRGQAKTQGMDQFAQIYRLVGQNPVAPVFFITLLYVFKRPEASDYRWCVFLMFLFAFAGMCVSGLEPANNLYIFFIPIMTLYGFAYVMMLWSRLEINIPLLRYAFICLIYAISFLPMACTLTAPYSYMVNWPPYVPPSIARLNGWTNDNEIIASDMPWAVAWYADRKSLQIPVSISDFYTYYDWSEMTGNLVGLYLTPITGNKMLVSDVLKGEDKDWAPFITRGFRSKDFPFKSATAMEIDNECVFYCESDRWSQKAD